MAPTLPALLCLGEMGRATPPKPNIWAEPGSVVPWGSPVTIWYQGPPGALDFRLDKEGISVGWDRQKLLEAGDKAKFSIHYMGQDNTGSYQCYYSIPTRWSEPSDPLELVLTGRYGKPSLSALPSPVVTSGGSVTLQCGSRQGFDRFLLTKEGEDESSQTLDGQRCPDGQTQALFPVGPVTPGLGWTFRCYGFNRDSPRRSPQPGTCLSPGLSGKPSLLTPQGPVVTSGQNLTLQCRSDGGYTRFALSKEGGQDLAQRPAQRPRGELSQANFPLGLVGTVHGGRYRCYGGHGLSSEWSAPSEPLELLVAGEEDRPSLSVWPGPSVGPGETVTLLCQSGNRTDTFLLSKEGAAHRPLRLRSWDQDGRYQAEFSLSPVIAAHGGTYRCYRSLSTDPYLLSQPSEPLVLEVSGEAQSVRLTQPQRASVPRGAPRAAPRYPGVCAAPGLTRRLSVLIGVPVAFVLLLLALLLLFLRHQGQDRRRTSVCLKNFFPQYGGSFKTKNRIYHMIQQIHCRVYEADSRRGWAPCEPPRLRRRREVPPSPAGWGDSGKDGQTQGRWVLLSGPPGAPSHTPSSPTQAAMSKAPQDVTYAQLNHSIVRRVTAAIPSPSAGETPADPSEYTALAIR
uniref:Ig-like domain-containing protein n=1 Tax=Moschus moschiferus TaxID=68415 RepID=A0A8C6FFD1_MOSMO